MQHTPFIEKSLRFSKKITTYHLLLSKVIRVSKQFFKSHYHTVILSTFMSFTKLKKMNNLILTLNNLLKPNYVEN